MKTIPQQAIQKDLSPDVQSISLEKFRMAKVAVVCKNLALSGSLLILSASPNGFVSIPISRNVWTSP